MSSEPPLFDMRFSGARHSALCTQIIPFLARVIGKSRQETIVVNICPREDLGLALKTFEKHVRRMNDADHEGLSLYRFSVTDLSVRSAVPYKPGFLRIDATRRDAAEVHPQQSLFEE